MKRLVPPDFPAPVRELPTVTVPVDGIYRLDLLTSWRAAMTPPKPDSKCLVNDMNAWAHAIGRATWFGDRYALSAKSFLTDPTVALVDPEGVEAASRACADAVEPLTRYSAGWVRSLDVLRPRGLTNQVTSAIREAQRWSATRVREDMRKGGTPVQETQARLDSFLSRPEVRHARDEQLALNAFATKLGATVLRWQENREADPQRDAVFFAQRQVAITDYGAVPEKTRSAAEQAELRQRAKDFLDPVMERLVAAGKYSPEHLSEAYLRVLTTYTNRLAKGEPLEGSEHTLVLRLGAVRVDEIRRRTGRGRLRSFASDPSGDGRSDDRIEDPAELDDELARLVGLVVDLIRADSALRVDGELCWEAQTAVDLLERTDTDLGALDAVADRVERAWCEARSGRSRSASAKQAATDVMLMLRTFTSRALRIREESSGGDGRR